MTADHQKPTPTAFDPKDAKPGANPNIPSDLNDPRNPKSPHPAEPTEQQNRVIKQPRKE